MHLFDISLNLIAAVFVIGCWKMNGLNSPSTGILLIALLCTAAGTQLEGFPHTVLVIGSISLMVVSAMPDEFYDCIFRRYNAFLHVFQITIGVTLIVIAKKCGPYDENLPVYALTAISILANGLYAYHHAKKIHLAKMSQGALAA